MWFIFRRRKTAARTRGAELRDARSRTRDLEDGQPTTTQEATIRYAEKRADALEERADKVADTLRHRLHRNHFAEGIALSWGQSTPHHPGGG